MTSRLLATVAFLSLSSCKLSATAGAACPEEFPSLPDAGDVSPSGCYAGGLAQVCEEGASTTCTATCAADEQAVTCFEVSTGPDSALGCRVVPVPTPSGVTFYCCPCKG